MKKAIATMLSLAIVLSTFLFDIQVNAATLEKPQLVLTQTDVMQGDIFTSTLYFEKYSSISAASFTFAYNPEYVELISCVPNEDCIVTPVIKSDIIGSISISIASGTNISAKMPLIDVSFKVNDDLAVGKYDLLKLTGTNNYVRRLDNDNILQTVEFDFITSDLNIYGAGDINLDGKVDGSDAVYMLRYEAGLNSGKSDLPFYLPYYENIDEYNEHQRFILRVADAYYDGTVNGSDAVSVLRHEVGFDEMLGNRTDVIFCDEDGKELIVKNVIINEELKKIPEVSKKDGMKGMWSLSLTEYVEPNFSNVSTKLKLYPYYITDKCDHTMQRTAAKSATCTEDGNIEYWYCPKCNKYFSDEAGTSEISLEDTIIQASGHTYFDVWSCDNDCHWYAPNCVHKDDENIELKDLSEHTYIDHKCSVCSHIEEFVVTFYDYDDTVLDIQMVAYGNGANEPEIPEHSGLEFDKWDQSFSYITGDTDVKAKYNHNYTVKFIDYDGSVLKTESVLEGHSATEPEIPERMGYTFNGWDKPFSNIVENTVVTAIYLQNKCTVQFVMPDGSSIEKRENITYGSSLEEPANSDVFSEYYFDFTNHTYNEFSGWNKSLKNVTFDNNGDTLTFEAQYNIPYNQPVIALEIKNNDCLQASIYMPKSCYVYGIDFGFNWSDDIGITSYNLNENACPLYNPPQEEKGHPDEDVSVIYNNKTKSFEYIWMCGNGHTVTKAESTYIVLIEEIDFAISGDAKLNQEVISVLDSCSIFYSDHGHCTFEDLIQINPIVVVK